MADSLPFHFTAASKGIENFSLKTGIKQIKIKHVYFHCFKINLRSGNSGYFAFGSLDDKSLTSDFSRNIRAGLN